MLGFDGFCVSWRGRPRLRASSAQTVDARDAHPTRDTLDAGDDVEIGDDFSSNSITLAYDNNGNLTDDGILNYVYDGWNRLRKATRRVDAETLVAEYRYDGRGRRVRTVITSSGPEFQPAGGGETDTHFYCGATSASCLRASVPSCLSSVIETRNGSNQVTFQCLRGRSGELVWAETNGDPTIGNDANPDNEATGEGAESPADLRCFAHADRDGALVALTEYDPEGTNNGRVVARYAWARHGFHVTLDGVRGDGERGSLRTTSSGGIDLLCNADPKESHRLGNSQSQPTSQCEGQSNSPPPERVPDEPPPPPPPPDWNDCAGVGDHCGDAWCSERCAEYQSLSSSPLFSFTLCCNGAPCMCVCQGNWPPYTTNFRDIFYRCAEVHEQIHVDLNHGWCERNNCEGASFPPQDKIDECYARGEGLRCLAAPAGQCTTDECREEACDLIAQSSCIGLSSCPPSQYNSCQQAWQEARQAYGCN